MSLTPEVLIQSLDEVIEFLSEIRAAATDQPDGQDTSPTVEPSPSSASKPTFSSRCTHCGCAIHWATTFPNMKKVALDQRSGSYFLRGDGKAVWGKGDAEGYAYHYDSSPDGCPSARPEQDDEPPRREWQDIYD
jgi:hypothetical protein